MSARILIIDDETNIRLMMRLALEHSGFEVQVASDGIEGLEKFGNGESWDVVVLDHRMPGLSGSEVQQQIIKRNPNARIIMVTAFGTINLALESIQQGASDFLRKPFTAETLRRAVQSALDRPVERLSAVPVGLAVREFTRTTINGFSFNLIEEPEMEDTDDYSAIFEVSRGDDAPTRCRVTLPAYVQELAKAHADSDSLPGGTRFWQAMCEEALANYLWQQSDLPANGHLKIEDLTIGLKSWMDAMLTVELADKNA